MSIPLIDSIENAMNQQLPVRKPKVTTVANAGNWRTVYQHILNLVPKIGESEDALKHPVVFGRDEAVYLVSAGKRGAAEFKDQVGKLLANHNRIIVLDAQRITCLKLNPDCISDLLKPGQSATLYYEKHVDPMMLDFLNRSTSIVHEPDTLQLQDIDVAITDLANVMQDNVISELKGCASDEEKKAILEIPHRQLVEIQQDLANQFVERNVGYQQLHDWTRKRIVSLMLKHVVPAYSSKTGEDPLEFFNDHLRDRFIKYKLPRNALNEAAPNLSSTLKTKKRFSEIDI